MDRLPPHHLEAEQSVLGSLLLDPQAYDRVGEFLRPDDFYREAHREIYDAVVSLNDRGVPVDLITLADELGRRDRLDAVGDVAYLTLLANAVPTPIHIEHYARIVERDSIRRKLIQAAVEISNLATDGDSNVDGMLDRAEQLLFAISQRRTASDFMRIGSLLHTYLDQVTMAHEHHSEVTGVASGFIDLDRLTSGFQPSDFIIIGARPSMGKTAFAVSLAHATAIRHGTTVGIFALEMSALQIVQRFVSIEAQVDQQRLRTGFLDEMEWNRVIQAMSGLSSAPIYIDDTPGITVLEMRAKARRLASVAPLGLLVIDYLQLVQGNVRNEGNRVQEISEISRSLKGLARELNVPIIALAQLSRGVESRQDHRPMLSDLRESGSLEQDADIVMFIYRDEIYNPSSDRKGIADIIIAKHRNGPVGQISLRWMDQTARFADLATYQRFGDE
ncbi:MAG: replicative DNA helicase [Chloroflexi bacterium]|nr:replicative DNA helicase [Chloroflexota bacterium]